MKILIYKTPWERYSNIVSTNLEKLQFWCSLLKSSTNFDQKGSKKVKFFANNFSVLKKL